VKDCFKEQTIDTIQTYKNSGYGDIKIYSPNKKGLYITPITFDCINKKSIISKLTKWRQENQHGFSSIFEVTDSRTKKWIKQALLDREDRLLFMVYDDFSNMIGHLGISSFNFENLTCEIDNVVRGEVSEQKKVMHTASMVLISWIKDNLKPNKIKLRVLNDNSNALSLYYRLGFKLNSLHPLQKIDSESATEWVKSDKNNNIDRFFIEMILNKGIKNE
jgi:RimJ/RimL family protein N-acetyltransferase